MAVVYAVDYLKYVFRFSCTNMTASTAFTASTVFAASVASTVFAASAASTSFAASAASTASAAYFAFTSAASATSTVIVLATALVTPIRRSWTDFLYILQFLLLLQSIISFTLYAFFYCNWLLTPMLFLLLSILQLFSNYFSYFY